MNAPAASAVALAALALAGCGASHTAHAPPNGRTLFVQYCGGCHTLAAAGTSGTVAQDLDVVRPTRPAVLRTLATGTRLMKPGLLTGADADAVAGYVARVAGRR